METVLARLKVYDKRRGQVLRCYTYRGIKFLAERGWVRVSMVVGDYLRTVRSEPRDPHSPLGFDVCTDEEARALEAAEARDAATRQNATSDLRVTVARGERVGERAPAAERAPVDASASPAPAAPAAPAGDAEQNGARDTKTRKDR